MYFDKSTDLINQGFDKTAVKKLDRELAHVYKPQQANRIDHALLRHQTQLPQADLANLLDRYEAANTVSKHNDVECSNCGTEYNPMDGSCLNCGVSEAVETDNVFYIIERQPQKPAFDPARQPEQPNIFISYRHNDTAVLAADIYYSLLAERHSVFLDNGVIPVGADAEAVFLRAASRADYFIALVSPTYFESSYCKKEIAHAARAGKRLIRVNIEPVPDAPNDMPWINSPNWLSEKGNGNGLSPDLETALLNAVKTDYRANIANLKEDACIFLLEQLSRQALYQVWNRMRMNRDFGNPPNANNEIIGLILQEASGARLAELCNALTV